MDQQQLLQKVKATDGVIGRATRLRTLTTTQTDTNIRFLEGKKVRK